MLLLCDLNVATNKHLLGDLSPLKSPIISTHEVKMAEDKLKKKKKKRASQKKLGFFKRLKIQYFLSKPQQKTPRNFIT